MVYVFLLRLARIDISGYKVGYVYLLSSVLLVVLINYYSIQTVMIFHSEQ